MNKKLIISIIVILVIVLAIGAYFFFVQQSGRDKKEPEEIVIGYNADQSIGPTAAFGVWGRQGFEIAIEEINAEGGILGRKIKPIIFDDKADASTSKKNIEQLIFEHRALAVIGPASSVNALYWLDLAQDNELIVFPHIATATEITTKYSERPKNYIFGIRTLDKDQARLSVAWLIKETNNGKIAVIHDSTSYGTQGLKDVNETLTRWGKVPVFVGEFNRGAGIEELIELIESAKTVEADAIIFYALADSTADFLKASEEVANYEPVLMGTAANASILWQLSGSLASKIVFTAPVSANFNEKTKELNQKIIDKYGEAPIILSSAASGYDAVYLLKAAIEKAGTIDNSAVRDALENIERIDGIMRTFFRPFSKDDHETLSVTDSFLSRWVDGEIVIIDEDISTLEIR